VAGHPIFAPLYGRVAAYGERAGVAAHRDELLGGLTGRVIEVGAGSGLCFGHYPDSVTEVMATEPEPYLRHLAERAAARAPVPVRVIDSRTEQLPFDDGSFGAVVASLVLCSVRDPKKALAEMYRVLRPGGQFRFYEHVRSDDPSKARLQERVDWIWPHLLGGCHANRDTASAITAAGFRIEARHDFEFRLGTLSSPASPHVIGTAVRS
jgi:ubiquinone/menaquinone biosynthesis C-methylase UbiE